MICVMANLWLVSGLEAESWWVIASLCRNVKDGMWDEVRRKQLYNAVTNTSYVSRINCS
jgi:hypothetical protein